MTEPVILLGTQSNGETLPVQVDAFGRLVAEGLQGTAGPEGPEGPPGVDGGSFPLPPDPFEGAVLGWYNGELAWLNEGIPIVPGLIGPITDWNPQNGILSVDGTFPPDIDNGVYLWLCEQDGSLYRQNCVVSDKWMQNAIITSGEPDPNYPEINAFDGDTETVWYAVASAGVGSQCRVTFDPPLVGTTSVFWENASNSYSTNYIRFNNGAWQNPQANAFIETFGPDNVSSIDLKAESGSYTTVTQMGAITNGGKTLVDNTMSTSFRVQRRIDDSTVTGAPINGDLVVGKYLKIIEQRVAPWVLYGNDPTSLIDHLRSS